MLNWFQDSTNDINSNINLQQRLDEIEAILNELEITKLSSMKLGSNGLAYDELRNNIFQLKYEILERI